MIQQFPPRRSAMNRPTEDANRTQDKGLEGLVRASFGDHRLYRTVLENITDALYVRGPGRELLYMNPAAERLTGWSRTKAEVLPCYEVFGDVGQACNRNCPVDRACAERTSVTHVEGNVVRKDGTKLPVAASISPVYEGDHVVASIVLLSDLTELQALQRANNDALTRLAKMHEALQKSESLFRDFAEVSSDWFWETDEEHRFRDVFGESLSPPSSFLGKTRRDVIAHDVAPDVWSTHEEDLAARRSFRDFVYPMRGPGGHLVWVRISGKPIQCADGSFAGYRGVGHDVTAEMEARRRIERLASYDDLTGLANRRLFDDLLAKSIARATRDRRMLALLMIDLDGFKAVNDGFGHQAGDALLIDVGDRLTVAVRASDTVARLGGDEFAVIVPDAADQRAITAVAQKIVSAVRQPVTIGDNEVAVSASVGIAVYPDDAVDPAVLFRRADMAMYAAKNAGKNNYVRYVPPPSTELSKDPAGVSNPLRDRRRARKQART